MRPFALLGQLLFGKLPFCSVVGAYIGVIAGTIIGLAQPAFLGMTPSLAALFVNSLPLALAGWVFVLLLFGLWLHYGLGVIALPAAVNAILTAFLTLWLCLLGHLPALDVPIGMVVGILVGWVLCRFCRPLSRATGRLANG